MDECQVIMGVERGREIREFVERMTGACPCSSGQRCPLMPASRAVPVTLALPRQRAPGADSVAAPA